MASFDADGQPYELRLTFNALCSFEKARGKSVMQAFPSGGESVSMIDIRELVRCGLTQKVTEERAGEIIDAAGLGNVMEAVEAAINDAFPAAKEAPSGNG